MHIDVGEGKKADFEIDDNSFKSLYESELAEHTGPVKGGACMRNTAKLARYFESQGVNPSDMRFLYIVAPTPVGPDIIRPNTSMLRPEEQLKLKQKITNKLSGHTMLQ